MRLLASSHYGGGYLSLADIYRIPYEILLDSSEAQQFVSLDTLRTILGHPLGQQSMPTLSKIYLRIYLSQFVDTDVFPYLEYATPRGNATKNQDLLIPAFLAQWTGRPVTIPFRNLPNADLPLAQAILAYRNGACDEANRFIASDAVTLSPDESALFEGCTPTYGMSVVDPH
jgi:hypothetical protein